MKNCNFNHILSGPISFSICARVHTGENSTHAFYVATRPLPFLTLTFSSPLVLQSDPWDQREREWRRDWERDTENTMKDKVLLSAPGNLMLSTAINVHQESQNSMLSSYSYYVCSMQHVYCAQYGIFICMEYLNYIWMLILESLS